jgi:PTS system nitrogen regulatory IIA component
MRDSLLTAVLEREALMSTSIGRGIALPHPRTPPLTERGEQFVALGFTRRPVDWNALDGKPVGTVILILSASAKMHLHTLSKINFLCRQDSFAALLERRAAGEEIVRMIEATEKTWI